MTLGVPHPSNRVAIARDRHTEDHVQKLRVRVSFGQKSWRLSSLLAVGRNVELKWIRVSSLALRWMLAASLTASPLLAEQSLQSDIVVPAHRPVVQVLDENNNPMVGTSILSAVLMDSQGKELASSSQDTNAVSAGQIATERAATELGAAREPAGRPSEKRAEPGGKTWSDLLIAALIAGGVVALILLLRGGHDKPGTAAAPHTVTGTILAPGTPSVTAPHK